MCVLDLFEIKNNHIFKTREVKVFTVKSMPLTYLFGVGCVLLKGFT